MPNTTAQLAQTVFDNFNVVNNRLTTERAPSLSEIIDSKNRLDAATAALNELADVSMGEPPAEESLSVGARLGALNVLINELKRYLNTLLKGRAFTLTMESVPGQKRNVVTGGVFSVVATVQSETQTLIVGINARNQYVCSSSEFWEDI